MPDEPDPDQGPLDSKARRRVLAATGGAISLGALAGCTGEEGDGEGDDGELSRPAPDGINVEELDPVLTFLVRSHHYQNQLLEREYGGG